MSYLSNDELFNRLADIGLGPISNCKVPLNSIKKRMEKDPVFAKKVASLAAEVIRDSELPGVEKAMNKTSLARLRMTWKTLGDLAP